jgi:plastocyanin
VPLYLNGSASRRLVAALFAIAAGGAVAACSSDRAPGAKAATARAESSAKTDDSAAGTVDLGGTAYTPETVASPGSVSGTITLTGGARTDTLPVTVDQPVCGKSVDGPVTATAKGLSNSVVWIADIPKGKPVTEFKRIDLSSEDCVLDPRVQAAVVGTTVNVTNADKLLHKLIFTPIGTHDTLTTMPFFNTGQVVASERLAKSPGIVEVTCALHPWTRAYIAVFDHPYFAVTGDDGKFTIDSLPPGTYKMMVWHEGAAQPVAQQIQVAPNGSAKVDVALTIK